MTQPPTPDKAALARLTVDRVRRSAANVLVWTHLYRLRPNGAHATEVLFVPQDLRTADPTFVTELEHGQMGLAGFVADLAGRSPFEISPPNPNWEERLHSFSWLRHMRAAREEGGDIIAKRMRARFGIQDEDESDEAQAARWYKQAADRGFARAQYNLGLLLEDGRGVTKNEAAAAGYYRAAAEQGFAAAQNNYGLMFSEGRGGLTKDPVQAWVWLSLAVENGASPAARDFVARGLGAEQLVVLVFPTRGDLAGYVEHGERYWSTLLEALAARDLAALDLTPPLAEAAREAGGVDALYLDSHLGPRGNQIVAQALAGWLAQGTSPSRSK